MSKTLPTPSTFTLCHGECEHDGDIERDLDAMRRAGARFTVSTSLVANGPEVGFTVIRSRMTAEQLRATTTECCIDAIVSGDQAHSLLSEAESEYAYEEGEDEDYDY